MKRLIGCALALGIVLWGCEWSSMPMLDDKPVTEMEAELPPAVLVAGPYLSATEPGRATVCFVTDRPVASAVSLERSSFRRTIRSGKPMRVHTLDLMRLIPGATYDCEVLLGGNEVHEFALQAVPEEGGHFNLAFVSGGLGQAAELQQVLTTLMARSPVATVFTGAQVDRPQDLASWHEGLLSGHREVLNGRNLLHAPDLDIPEEVGQRLFPGQAMGRSFTARLGPAEIVFLAGRELQADHRYRLDAWLNRALQTSIARFKIIVFPKPLLWAREPGVRVSELAHYAPIFEKHKVDLVLSAESPYYHRSKALGTAEHAVTYVNLPALKSLDLSQQSELPMATAARHGVAGGLVLEMVGGRLHLSAVDLAGQELDRVLLPGPGAQDGPLLSQTVIDGARAYVRQKRELAAIARQAVRAVPDPEDPKQLHFVLSNASPQAFHGTLRWEQENALFEVSPDHLPFDLQPGTAARSTFRLRPNASGQEMPVLVVTDRSGRRIRQPLLLTRLEEKSLPRTTEAMILDGRGKEDFWDKALVCEVTRAVDGTPAGGPGALGRVIAAPEGLRIAFRCPFAKGTRLPRIALRRDHPVWKEESVEIFIDPKNDGRHCLQFALSAHGVPLDAGSDRGTGWSPDWRHAVDLRSNRYNVEVEIPYEALGWESAPAAGTEIGFNLTRNDYSGAALVVSQLTPTFGRNDRSGLYLKLRF